MAWCDLVGMSWFVLSLKIVLRNGNVLYVINPIRYHAILHSYITDYYGIPFKPIQHDTTKIS